MPSFADAGEAALAAAEPGDMLLTLGAGNVYQLGPMLLERLQSREEAEVQHGRC
jgi:UDP-N-acetylmuramate--alanine ligase